MIPKKNREILLIVFLTIILSIYSCNKHDFECEYYDIKGNRIFEFEIIWDILASSRVAANLGIATAAKIPIITITKINSIIVNPRLKFFILVLHFIIDDKRQKLIDDLTQKIDDITTEFEPDDINGELQDWFTYEGGVDNELFEDDKLVIEINNEITVFKEE